MAWFRSCSRSAACDRSERPSRRGTATWAPAGPRTGGRGGMDAVISLRTATLAIVCHLQVHIWWHHHPPFNSLTFRTNWYSWGDLHAVLHRRAQVAAFSQMTGGTVVRCRRVAIEVRWWSWTPAAWLLHLDSAARRA